MQVDKFKAPLAIALSAVASFGIIALGHVITDKPLVFLDYRLGKAGLDYVDFYWASAHLVVKGTPYVSPRYVTTPIPALLNIPLALLGLKAASVLLLALIPLSVFAGYLLIAKAWGLAREEEVPLAGFLLVLVSYPFYFLLERENIDGWVFLFLAGGVWASLTNKRAWLSGLLFSLAIVFKIYPALVILPLILYRRKKVLLWLFLWLALWGIVSLPWLTEMLAAVSQRTHLLRLDENGSLAALALVVWGAASELGLHLSSASIARLSTLTAYVLYGVLLFPVLYADFKQGAAAFPDGSEIVAYFPFMVAVPSTVYHYSYIVLLALVPLLTHWQRKRLEQRFARPFFLIAVGVSLSQWQAIALARLTQNPLSHALPALGLLLIMLGIGWYKMLMLLPLSGGAS